MNCVVRNTSHRFVYRDIYTAPAHRAVALNRGDAALVRSYDTRAHAPTQRQLVVQHDPFESFGLMPMVKKMWMKTQSAAARAFRESPNGTVLPVKPNMLCIASSWHIYGSHILQAPRKALVIHDKNFWQRLLLARRSDVTLRQAADSEVQPTWYQEHVSHGKHAKCSCIARLFKAFVQRHPRLASLDDVEGSLHFRDFPEDERAQDRAHNECMTSVRLTLHQVSELRVKWILAAGVTAHPRKARQETEDSADASKKEKSPQVRGSIVTMRSKAPKTVIQNHEMCFATGRTH